MTDQLPVPRWRAVGLDQDIVGVTLIDLHQAAEGRLPPGRYRLDYVWPPDRPPLAVGELIAGPAGSRIETDRRLRGY